MNEHLTDSSHGSIWFIHNSDYEKVRDSFGKDDTKKYVISEMQLRTLVCYVMAHIMDFNTDHILDFIKQEDIKEHDL